jgi:LmeA-like phospholipid-binding
VRKLLIAVGVVVLLLVVADRVSKHVVESRLADRIESRERVDGVAVDIGGFPFLTQVVARHFDDVDVTMPLLRAQTAVGGVAVHDVRISLHDVKATDRFTRATAASATGTGLVPYSAFDAFAPVRVGYGGPTDDGSGYLEISAPTLGGGSIRVVPSVVDGTSLSLDALSPVTRVLPPSLRTFVSGGHALEGLLDGVTVRSVEATPDGIAVTLAGRHVRIAR